MSFSCKRCFLSFHLTVKGAEVLIQSGIEDHAFRPRTASEHFPEEELALGENKLLEVDSLAE